MRKEPAKEDVPNERSSSLPSLSRRHFLQVAGAASVHLATGAGATASELGSADTPPTGAEQGSSPADSEFAVEVADGAIVGLRRTDDALNTEWVQADERLGDAVIQYRQSGGDWQAFETAGAGAAGEFTSSDDGTSHEAVYRVTRAGSSVFDLTVGFVVEPCAVRWTLRIQNRSDQPLEIGDLAVPLRVTRRYQPGESERRTARILKHSLVSGDGSLHFWMRSNSVGPFLTMTPEANTHLEYWEAQDGYRVFIHSAVAGTAARERGCDWRQPNTSLILSPAGASGQERTYGFKLRWAEDYGGVREILVDEGLIDVNVIPGMTVPTDLTARIALRTREPVDRIDAEFPEETTLRRLGAREDVQLWEVRFARLGENQLTVRFGDNRHMHLEFFCTEPIETLIAKRAAFVAKHQIRDPSKWYDGLLAEWAMDTQVQLSPDNYDRIRGWRIYAVTCDDPGLSKPAFLSSKNAEYPNQAEVDALDYYIERFVWGGLQRTTDETFAYGIYGIPDWQQNRESEDPGRNGRLHIWRIYDYPHVVLMYFGMYRVAKRYPHIRTALSAAEYLRRAYGTAVALFTVPYEVERWSAYRTGLYNELVILDLLEALEAEGMGDHALRLRMHWDRKVQHFINDDPNLFQSEYAFDSTGFESTHALARYAVDQAERLAEERPESDRFPPILPESTRRFMETQIEANLFCRGWLETAYYYLGSDYRGGGGNGYTLSYMAQMGGWSLLDYALYFADDPAPYLRLGYASFLSSWALMNTGTPQSDYGYWYPGPENDGGAGGGFEPAPFGTTWLEQPHSRGSWYYSCEIDLGFCGALRAAATVLADDPIFGRICYGGDLRETDHGLEVVPRDGVRKRCHFVLGGRKLHLIAETDRFAATRPFTVNEELSDVSFEIESDNALAHSAMVHVSGLPPGRYSARNNAEVVASLAVGAETDTARLELPMDAGPAVRRFHLARDPA